MEFYEYILNSSKVIERHDFVKKLLLKMFKGMQLKKYIYESYDSSLCMSPNVG